MAYETCPDCGTQKHQLMACPKCGFQRNKMFSYQGHESSSSSSAPSEPLPATPNPISDAQPPVSNASSGSQPEVTVTCPRCPARVKKANLHKHISEFHGAHRKGRKEKRGIRLISKRGTILKGRYTCSNCGSTVDNPTRYTESNRGSVILCASCKSAIRLRSFPKDPKDALDFARTGGRFEGNRRRH